MNIKILSKSQKTIMNDQWLIPASKDHFWMDWRFNFLVKKLKKLKIKIKKLSIMDLGCGNGKLSYQLENLYSCKVDRVDSNLETLKLNKKIRGKLICYNIYDKNKKLINHYDIIFLFDVIEHIKNEQKFLKTVLLHLKKGGILVINVPSLQVLFSHYDTAVGHLRRYKKRDFLNIAKNLNVKILSINYWGFSLLPILLIRKIILFVLGAKNSNDKKIKLGWKSNNFLNTIFKSLMKIELATINNPILGTSIMCVFKK